MPRRSIIALALGVRGARRRRLGIGYCLLAGVFDKNAGAQALPPEQ